MGVYSNNPDYWKGSKSTGAKTERNGDVEVSGFAETSLTLGHLMTTDPYMAANLKKVIRKVIKEARKRVSDDIAKYLEHDPRKAARAVKYSVYKSIFGGNISILQKRAGTAGQRRPFIRQTTLQPGQRGGNRRLRGDDGRNRLDTYFGADRGFVLRFISSGTVERITRYGSRGNIRQRNMFGHIAPWQMQAAADDVAKNIAEYIKHETNG